MSHNPAGEVSPQQTVNELKGMVSDYARQETVEPLKRLGKWVAWGVAGAVFIVLGVSLLTLGLLRVLQEEVDAFDGGKSWIPYLIALGGLALALVPIVAGLKRSIDLTDRSQP